MAEKLAAVFSGLGQGMGKTIEACLMTTLWGDAVGEKIGAHTEAIKIVNRTLYVTASSATWAQELTFIKRELMNKFNEFVGKEAINDIRISAKGFTVTGGKNG